MFLQVFKEKNSVFKILPSRKSFNSQALKSKCFHSQSFSEVFKSQRLLSSLILLSHTSFELHLSTQNRRSCKERVCDLCCC